MRKRWRWILLSAVFLTIYITFMSNFSTPPGSAQGNLEYKRWLGTKKGEELPVCKYSARESFDWPGWLSFLSCFFVDFCNTELCDMEGRRHPNGFLHWVASRLSIVLARYGVPLTLRNGNALSAYRHNVSLDQRIHFDYDAHIIVPVSL